MCEMVVLKPKRKGKRNQRVPFIGYICKISYRNSLPFFLKKKKTFVKFKRRDKSVGPLILVHDLQTTSQLHLTCAFINRVLNVLRIFNQIPSSESINGSHPRYPFF
jgi:hypothetical protein